MEKASAPDSRELQSRSHCELRFLVHRVAMVIRSYSQGHSRLDPPGATKFSRMSPKICFRYRADKFCVQGRYVQQTQAFSSPSTILTISYLPPVPVPFLPLPNILANLPSPLKSVSSSFPFSCGRAGVAFALPTMPPKLIGFNSRHWHVQMPKEIINAELQACRPHHK